MRTEKGEKAVPCCAGPGDEKAEVAGRCLCPYHRENLCTLAIETRSSLFAPSCGVNFDSHLVKYSQQHVQG